MSSLAKSWKALRRVERKIDLLEQEYDAREAGDLLTEQEHPFFFSVGFTFDFGSMAPQSRSYIHTGSRTTEIHRIVAETVFFAPGILAAAGGAYVEACRGPLGYVTTLGAGNPVLFDYEWNMELPRSASQYGQPAAASDKPEMSASALTMSDVAHNLQTPRKSPLVVKDGEEVRFRVNPLLYLQDNLAANETTRVFVTFTAVGIRRFK